MPTVPASFGPMIDEYMAKYPVQLSKFEYIHKTEIVRVCPHIQVPPDRTKFCIQYLEGNSFQ